MTTTLDIIDVLLRHRMHNAHFQDTFANQSLYEYLLLSARWTQPRPERVYDVCYYSFIYV